MYVLDNVVQSYAWGSHSAIAELLGRPRPTAKPEAELWMGAHPSAPSRVSSDGETVPLSDAIAKDPDRWLGADTVARFGLRLPFLFKVLAAEEPLSLQAHPNTEQALRGFAREEAAGVPREASTRNYKDASAKPEVLCALEPFEALFGFRGTAATCELLLALEVPALAPCIADLTASPGPEGLRRAFERLVSIPADLRGELVGRTAAACQRMSTSGDRFRKECAWGVQLAQRYPTDVGVVVALMMNLVELGAGEAIYVPAGKLHAYLHGTGVELMASSDNVLRGGLTTKHVDRDELLDVLRFDDERVATVPCRAHGPEQIYDTPASEFRLSQLRVEAGAPWKAIERVGPEILLCIEGDVELHGSDGAHAIARKGSSLFITPASGAYEIAGRGLLFRATVGQPR